MRKYSSMEDFGNFHFKIKISYGRKYSNFACAEMIQIASSLLRIYAQSPILYKWIFALYADNPRKQAFQWKHKQKFHHRMFCALRRNSKFGSIHTSLIGLYFVHVSISVKRVVSLTIYFHNVWITCLTRVGDKCL